MPSPDLLRLARHLLDLCRTQSLRLATAESCTGGLVAGAITDIAGSSDAFDCGFVTYSNAAKEEMLGVPHEILERHGAVSAETARAMASGAVERSFADIVVSITGIAGPGGGSAEKPVGLVHFACLRKGFGMEHIERRFGPETREAIREGSVAQALELMIAAAQRRP
ncbi:CinA family protein [Methylosinus sporium]|uniref:Damage-inducible protein CinA n=1 Tax=Methylosinus sporium TaxID=428 RepID=A0A2U1SNR4_METSR|nr:CinA family protein [Methylosinus sporium]PWB93248.1 damage-inducible protein CinA [Methylosinus sporium]